MAYPKWINNSVLGFPKKSEESMAIYRVGQALFNISVFNKKANNFLNSKLQNKYLSAKRYAKYVKDVAKVSQVVKMLIYENRRNSFVRILRKLNKTCQRCVILKPLISDIKKVEQIYSDISNDLNPDKEMSSAFRGIISNGYFCKEDKNTNELFLKMTGVIKIKIEKLVKYNCRLVNSYFHKVRRDEITDYKYQVRQLRAINKMVGKNK
jgi:hypothetical protein